MLIRGQSGLLSWSPFGYRVSSSGYINQGKNEKRKADSVCQGTESRLLLIDSLPSWNQPRDGGLGSEPSLSQKKSVDSPCTNCASFTCVLLLFGETFAFAVGMGIVGC